MATVIESVGVTTGARWRPGRARKLADAAALIALDRAGLTPGEIDLLLNAGLYHDRNLGEPALAALIQEDIGANPEDPHGGAHGTFSFDVANGSCGMLTGLHIADGFLRAGTIHHALVIASDANPGRRLAPGFPFTPAGAAIVCGWHPGDHGIQGFRFTPPPPGGGAGHAAQPEDGLRATVAFDHGRNRLAINQTPDFAPTAAACAADVASKLLAAHGLTPGDVDLVVANPLTREFLDALVAGLGTAPPTLATGPHTGHIHTAALGVALEPIVTGRHHQGTTILLVSAGAGPTAGAALLRQ